MADDITEFTNLKNLFNRVKDNPNYKLSEQNIKGLRGWSPTEIQILKNIKGQMSDESFLQKIKDIDKFDFSKYSDTAPKPAPKSAPKSAVGRVITLDEMIENGTVPETKPAPKPAANSTVPETKSAANGTAPKSAVGSTVPEAKPGFWTRMKSRWTPGIGQLPPAEDVGIKQAGRLKSILNGIRC